jgi:hypothetical protein
MTIKGMFNDPGSGDLRIVLEDKTVTFVGQDGKAFGPGNIVQKTVSDHGSDDELHIYTRTTEQMELLITASSIIWDKEKVQALRVIVSAYRDRLLEMLDCLLYIHKETFRCDKEFQIENGRVSLPHVKKLQEHVENFLLNGKRAAAEIAKVLCIFFDDAKKGHNYGDHKKWALERFGAEGSLYKILEHNTTGDASGEGWIKDLVELRNRVEHPRDGYRLVVNNIDFDPASNKMVPASWSSELHPVASDVRLDMEIFILNLVTLSEDIVAASVEATISMPNRIGVVSIPEQERDPKRPLRFRLGVFGLPTES